MTAADSLDLAFLGSGNAFAPARCWSGFIVNGRYLFDAPPTALYSLKRMGLDPAAIDTVFVSHFHADHFFGLPFLLLEYAYMTRRESDLTIVGPPGIEDRLRTLTELAYPSLLSGDASYGLRFVEVAEGCEGTLNGLRFSAVEVEHGGAALQCYGYRARIGARTLAYTGDSTYCDQLVEIGRGADVMVTDCTYASGRNNPEHMSLDEVRDLRDRVGADTTFILTHLGGAVDTSGQARLLVAEDAARYHF
jgi:ribonuclease BN (tRNA processing enzyme)